MDTTTMTTTRVHNPTEASTPTRRARRPRRGFSFAEILFAVAILGLGFIMVAAMFPVALHQSRTTVEETDAAAMARGVVAHAKSVALSEVLPPTGTPTNVGIDGSAGTVDDYLPPPRVYSIRDPQHPFVGTNFWLNDTNGLFAHDPDLTTPAVDLNTRTLDDSLWNVIRGVLVNDTSASRGAVVLYSRPGYVDTTNRGTAPDAYVGAGSAARLFVIVTEVRSPDRDQYDNGDVSSEPPAAANLQARPVTVGLTSDGSGGVLDQVVIFYDNDTAEGAGTAPAAVAEGAYLVIATHDFGVAGVEGLLNGSVYRIGARRADLDPDADHQAWELMPGNDFRFHPGTDGTLGTGDDLFHPGPDGVPGGGDDIFGVDAAGAFVVGREGTAAGFVGPAQDVAIYSTPIRVKQQ